MKQKFCLLAVLVSLLFCMPFLAMAEETAGLKFGDMTPIWSPSKSKLTADYYKGKVILLYYFSFKDASKMREVGATIQQLNKIQQQGAPTGAFTVVGSYIGMDAAVALNFFKQSRPMFPIYQNLVCQEQPKADQCTLVLIDSVGNVVAGSGKMDDLMLSLQHTVSTAMTLKRMKNFPVPHPLDGKNLTGKESAYLSLFDPGKPWQGAYKKIEKAIEKAGEDSGSLESIKSAIDDYMTKEIPAICKKAETEPAATLSLLTMLSKSVKGLAGEQAVSDALKPLQADKNVEELSKLIFAINKFKLTSGKLKPAALKARVESFEAQVNKFLTKPTLADNVKAEAEKLLAQLGQMKGGVDGPVPTTDDVDAQPVGGDQPAEADQPAQNSKTAKGKKAGKK